MRTRLTLVALAVACAAPAAASGASGGDLEIRAVADPVPTGQAGHYGLRLKATVANAGEGAAAADRVRFVLSEDRRLDRSDERLASGRTDALAPGERDVVTDQAAIGPRVEAGIYHVIACVEDDCRTADETVAVTEPGGETTAQAGQSAPGATAAPSAPREEYFPELGGMKTSAAEGCPASLHGQGDGRCVWVTTAPFRADTSDPSFGRERNDFWHCPKDYPYPFEVALGFDPLWRNTSVRADATVETVAAKRWTLYRSLTGRDYYPSYGGSYNRGERGYLSIQFRADALARTNWTQRAEYLCSSARASSMLP